MTFCWDKLTEEDFEEFKDNLADYEKSECTSIGHLYADNYDVSIIYNYDTPGCVTLSIRSYADSESDPPLYCSLIEECNLEDETYSGFVKRVENSLQRHLDETLM